MGVGRTLYLIEPSGEGLKINGQLENVFPFIKNNTNASNCSPMAIANGHLLVRSFTELVCLDVR